VATTTALDAGVGAGGAASVDALALGATFGGRHSRDEPDASMKA
jgi:hypothetical protein